MQLCSDEGESLHKVMSVQEIMFPFECCICLTHFIGGQMMFFWDAQPCQRTIEFQLYQPANTSEDLV